MSAAEELDALRPALARLGHEPSPADVAAAMREQGLAVSDESVLGAVAALRRESVGAGPLQPWLEADGVTDVLVNGAGCCYVDRGRGLERVPVELPDEAAVRRLAVRLATVVGRRLDDAHPFVDGRLADGTRLHAVLAPVAAPGTTISLRVPARRRLTLADWVRLGSLPPAGAVLLRRMVAARLAFLVSGGTGSGKTTLLASLLGEVDPDHRLLVVEDSRELVPAHPHCVWLEARPANADGAGAIGLTTLVRQALRMRPDRLVLGEVRGAEVVDLLVALNTGHEGGCGTVHANSAADVPARLEALGALAGLPREALAAQAAAALHAVVHVRRDGGRRRVAEVHVLERDGAALVTRPAVLMCDDGVVLGPGAARLEELLA